MAPPYESEVTDGALHLILPVFASRDDRTVVHVPPVGHVKADGAESVAGRVLVLFGNDLAGRQVQDGRLRVVRRNERELAVPLPEGFERLEHRVVTLVRAN